MEEVSSVLSGYIVNVQEICLDVCINMNRKHDLVSQLS